MSLAATRSPREGREEHPQRLPPNDLGALAVFCFNNGTASLRAGAERPVNEFPAQVELATPSQILGQRE